MKRPQALIELINAFDSLFDRQGVSREIVGKANIDDGNVEYSDASWINWWNIVIESLRQEENALDRLVNQAIAKRGDEETVLPARLDALKEWLKRNQMSAAQLADSMTPLTYLEIFLRRWNLRLIALLVIGPAFTVYWFCAPSRTSFTVAGVDPKTLAIEVKIANRGGRPATLTDDYELRFPSPLPIKPQKLKLASNTRIVPGHEELMIHLTASGLEPIVLSDGSYLTGEEAAKLLPRQDVTLHYRIEESLRSESRLLPFRAELIRELIKNKLPE